MPSQLGAMRFMRGEEIATNEQMSVSEMHSAVEEMGTVGGNVLAGVLTPSDWSGKLANTARQLGRQRVRNFTSTFESWQVGRPCRTAWGLINTSKMSIKTSKRSRHNNKQQTMLLPTDHLLPKLPKHVLGKRLGKEVSELVLGVDLAHADPIARVGWITS